MKFEKRKISELEFYPGNPRKMSKDMLDKLKKGIQEFGLVEPLVVNKKNQVIGGNQRLKALQELGVEEVDVVVVDLPTSKEKALNVALNKIQGEFDEELLKEFIEDLEPIDLELTGLDDTDLMRLNYIGEPTFESGSLARDYIIPPFSVLDTRNKTWQKARARWEELFGDDWKGIKEHLIGGKSSVYTVIGDGTSHSDPVISEVVYKWFMPTNGGRILNPMAGEPATGLVAGAKGYEFLGVDVREEQVEIDREKAEKYSLSDKVKYIVHNSVYLNEILQGEQFDLVFFSPPYYNIEVYSDNEEDISTSSTYDEFMESLAKIMENAANVLKQDRFFVMKVGDVREDKGPNKGKLLNFLGDIITAGERIGLKFYNDIVIVNAVGTSAFRARKIFKTRKIVRLHQRLLVFYKGNIDNIPKYFKDLSDDEWEQMDLGGEDDN